MPCSVDCLLVPVIRRDWSALVAMLRNLPAPSAQSASVSLVLSLDAEWIAEEKAYLTDVIAQSDARSAWTQVTFLSCRLPEEESVYFRDRPAHWSSLRLPYGLKSGPNRQFFTSLQLIMQERLAQSAVLLMETDVVALNAGWLDQLNSELSRCGSFLLAGAIYEGLTPQPVSVRNHLNGNAVLSVANSQFALFLSLWERLLLEGVRHEPMLPYDQAIEWGLANQDKFGNSALTGLARQIEPLYRDGRRELASIVNLSGPRELDPGYVFSVAETLTRFPEACMLHCRAAVPYSVRLRRMKRQRLAVVRHEPVVAFDGRWQFPAVTEEHAYQRALTALPVAADSVYLAFPWATLIDLVVHKPDDVPSLLNELRSLKPMLAGRASVVTVCQHIFLKRCLSYFAEMGVTDIFWSHAIQGEAVLGQGVRIHPFPLFPVQASGVVGRPDLPLLRPFLFSFVGARAVPGLYLSDVRTWIIEKLSGHPNASVVARNEWHFQKVVYDHQILQRAERSGLVNEADTQEFRDTLQKSVFSLCPSGSGPNSIRLWESIGLGAIPVIISDSWLPPGEREWWEAAAVFCRETPEAIDELPDLLARMASDAALMRRKRQALAALWRRYGPDGFIADVQGLLVADSVESPKGANGLDDRFIRLMETVPVAFSDDSHAAAVLSLACSHRIAAGAATFRDALGENAALRQTFGQVLDNAPVKHRQTLLRAMRCARFAD